MAFTLNILRFKRSLAKHTKKCINKKDFGEERKIQLKWQICVGLISSVSMSPLSEYMYLAMKQSVEKKFVVELYKSGPTDAANMANNSVELEVQLRLMTLVFLNSLPGLNLQQSV